MTKVAVLGDHTTMGLYGIRGTDELYRRSGMNTGNLAFIHAILTQIADPVTIVPWHARADAYRDVDIILIPCANQLGRHTDLGGHAKLLKEAGKPVVAIGLGAQAEAIGAEITLTEGTRAWVDIINSRRPSGGLSNIYTRGPYTSSQLARFDVPDSVPGGCPSHFTNPAVDLGKRVHAHWSKLEAPRALTVTGGHQNWAKARIVEQQLISLMQDPRCFGQYVVQSEADLVRVARGDFDLVELGTLEKLREHLTPHYTMDEFKAWCRMYARAFFDVPAWMDSLRNCDLTIGPRYHGTALALQTERMGVTVAIDSRTQELCMETGVPYLTVEDLQTRPITRASLKRMIKFDPVAYDKQRIAKARGFVAFLEGNGMSPAPFLYKIAEAAI
jgi:hypothetical protein